jgi:hypothetical protein
MSSNAIVRCVKGVGVVAAVMVLSTSTGSASAAPDASVGRDVAQPAAVATVAQPASWRETATTGVSTSAIAASRPSRAVVARRAQAAAFARYTNFTLHSKDALDMRGVERSLYRGKFYRSASESKRLCVVRRESEGHYDVVNPSGAYRGAYQVSASLARGATWMMYKEHKGLMGEKAAKQVLAKLRATPMNKWSRYWQDAAFHTIINWNGTLSGASHWAGGRWHC